MLKIFGLAIGSVKKIKKMEEDLFYYRDRYRFRIGSTKLIPDFENIDYRLFSPNRGKNWYALDNTGAIAGPVEDVYPGLMRHLEAWDELRCHVVAYGPLDSSNEEHRAMLKNAGVAVGKD